MTETLSTSKEIPKTRLALEEKYKNEPKEPHAKRLDPENIKEMVSQLPEPVGYRLLVLPFTPKEKTKGGIIIAQESLEKLRIATNCGYVLKVGPLAYYDKEKFPTGPWCKEGQFIVYGRYAGARFKTKYGEHRILNDDEIIGTINKPEDILALF